MAVAWGNRRLPAGVSFVYISVHSNDTNVTARPLVRKGHLCCTHVCSVGSVAVTGNPWKLVAFVVHTAFLSSFFFAYSVHFWPLRVVSDLLNNRNLFTVSREFFPYFVFSFLKFSLSNFIINSHDTGWVYLHLQEHYLIDSVILK